MVYLSLRLMGSRINKNGATGGRAGGYLLMTSTCESGVEMFTGGVRSY